MVTRLKRERGRTAVAGLFLLCGCRGVNPAFKADSQSNATPPPVRGEETSSGKTTPVETGVPTKNPVETNQTDSSNSPSPSTAASTTTHASQPATSSGVSTGTGTGTSTDYVVPRWDDIEPKPATSPSPGDLCNRGAKGCFIFDNHASTRVESQTPKYPGFYVTVTNGLAPPSKHTGNSPPLNGGVRLDSTNSNIASHFPYPRFKGQDFGIEIWYRSDPNPDYSNELNRDGEVRPVKLVQILTDIWLQEDPRNGGISCAMPTTSAKINIVPHPYQVGPSANSSNQGRPRDQLRVAACAISDSKIYVWSNGVMEPQHTNAKYQVTANILNQKIAFGGWVKGDIAAENFQALQGTIYMVRIWNNINYMRDAMVANLAHHKGSIDDGDISDLGSASP